MKKVILGVLLLIFSALCIAQSSLPSAVQDFFSLTPTYVSARALAANTAESVVIPASARFVMFSGNADFYVAYNATATIPGDTTDGSAAELNPSMRRLSGVQYISIISASTAIVTVSFYQ